MSNLHLAGKNDRGALYAFTLGLEATGLETAWVNSVVGQQALPTLERQEREETLRREALAQLVSLRQ